MFDNERKGSGRCIVLGAALAIVAVQPCLAQSSDENSGDVDEIVVRAMRIDRSVGHVPGAISTVGKDAIQLGRQQLGLDESLAAVPGLFMQDRYNFAQDLRIAIRGFGARSNFGIRGVKILVDGIPESLPDGQGQSDGIDLGSAAQIEVIRGPSSSLYGNASGGVISVTSERGPADPFVEARLSAGAFGFNQIQLKAGGDTGRFNYMLSASDMKLDGYREHSETENTQLNARLAFEIDSDSELAVVVNATDQPVANDPGGINFTQALAEPRSARQQNLDFDGGEALKQQRIGLSYKKRFGERHELRLRNHYVWRDFANKLPFEGGGIVQFDRFFVGGGASYSYKGDVWGRANTLIVGTDIDLQDDDRQRFDNELGTRGALGFDQNEQVSSVGVFVQNEIEFTDVLRFTVGLRYDEVEFDVGDQFLADGDDSGVRTLSETSPMLGVVISPNESLNLYATYSTAFETPTTTEFANPDGGGGFNASVNPQLATNFEVGLRGDIGGRHRYELALFSIDVDDELIPFELESQPGRDFFSNAGKSSREGLELALVSEPLDGLTLSLAYTYSDFEFDEFRDDNGNDFAGNAIPGVPDDLIRGEIAYTHPSGFFGALEILDVGDFHVNNANSAINEAYSVVNLRAGFAELSVGDWTFSPYVGVNNLSDEEYSSNVRINAFGGRFFEPAPERHVYGGVAVRYTLHGG